MKSWRTFINFPEQSICPICGENEDKLCVLIMKQGTNDGRICEAIPVHVDCLNPENMAYNDDVGIIYITAPELVWRKNNV